MMARYIEPGGGLDKYTFVVATNECGTQITSSRRTDISGAENIIIVQMDPLVQVGVSYTFRLTNQCFNVRRSGTVQEGSAVNGKTRTESQSGVES